jgi:hypothetical protein
VFLFKQLVRTCLISAASSTRFPVHFQSSWFLRVAGYTGEGGITTLNYMTGRKLGRIWLSTVVVLVSTLACSQVSTGKPPLGSFSSGPDVINLGNLNIHFDFPVIHKNGRGMPFDYILGFDNSVWTPTNVSGVLKWQPTSNFGWRAITEAAVGYVSYTQVRITCIDPDTFRQFPATQRYNYQYHDKFGTIHNFTNISGGCPGDTDPSDTVSTDSSGYTLHTSVKFILVLRFRDRGEHPPHAGWIFRRTVFSPHTATTC